MSGNNLAENSPPTTLDRVHPGGFFRAIQRGELVPQLQAFIAQSRNLAIIDGTDLKLTEICNRLRLSGVPIYEALEATSSSVMDSFLADGDGTLVANHGYVVEHGPIPVNMAIHLRPSRSVRQYAKLLEALPSAVHLTFVVPEDRKRALSLQSHFEHDQGFGEPAEVTLTEVIDLTEDGPMAALANQRRRFVLRR